MTAAAVVASRQKRREGLSLVETMVVLVIMIVVGRQALPYVIDFRNDAYRENMVNDLEQFRLAAERHRTTWGQYPTTVQASGAESATTMNLRLTDGITLTIANVTQQGYDVRSTSSNLTEEKCELRAGTSGMRVQCGSNNNTWGDYTT